MKKLPHKKHQVHIFSQGCFSILAPKHGEIKENSNFLKWSKYYIDV